MGYSIFIRLWALLPNWLLIALIACFFAYFTGVSHGRAPYKLATKLQKERAKLIIKHNNTIKKSIKRKGEKANGQLKNNACNINAADAAILSNIRG